MAEKNESRSTLTDVWFSTECNLKSQKGTGSPTRVKEKRAENCFGENQCL